MAQCRHIHSKLEGGSGVTREAGPGFRALGRGRIGQGYCPWAQATWLAQMESGRPFPILQTAQIRWQVLPFLDLAFGYFSLDESHA